MSGIDILLAVCLAYGLIRGFMNGFFAELASLVSTFIGIYAAIKFSSVTGNFLAKYINWNPFAIKAVAFVITFILVIIAISLLAKFLSGIAGVAGLGLANKAGGAFLGMFKLALIVGTAILFLEKLNDSKPLVNPEESLLYGPVQKSAALVFPLYEEAWDVIRPTVSAP